MHIRELFDKPQPYKWTRAGGLIFNRNNNDAKAKFKIGKHQYVFNAFNLKPGVYKVRFGQVDSNKKLRYDITNTGNEVPVISTIANIINDFITTYDPQVIMFSAEEASRQKLYARLAKRLVNDNWQIKQDGQFFTLTKNPQITELRELFDRPIPYEWTSKDPYQWTAEFDINDIKYEFVATILNPYPEEDEEVEIEIEFFHRSQRGVPIFKVSGVGNQHQVFTTVVDIIRDLINQAKPDVIIYSATEPNRAKLYHRMLARLLPNAAYYKSGNKVFVSLK